MPWYSRPGFVTFVWDCDNRYIFGQSMSVSTYCPTEQSYDIEITVDESTVTFRDTAGACGDLSLTDSIGASGPLYAYVGADADYGDGDAIWHSVEVCSIVYPSPAPTITPAPTVTKVPTVAHLRLVGGINDYEGRVEIYYNGQWGTVCDDYWDLQDAHVVCQQLFGTDALEARCCAYFGYGSGTIWMDSVDCSGTEAVLSDCPFYGWG